MIEIEIGANRETLQKMASDLEKALGGEGTEFTVYAHENVLAGQEVQIRFSNEDMEDRDDLTENEVLVEVSNDS